MKSLVLCARQVPFLLRSFFRQGNQVFWNYGFFLLLLVFSCTLLASPDPASLRPLLGGSVVLLTLMAGGVYGVSYGLWNFFRGGVVERYLRSPHRATALMAYLASRYLVLLSSVAIQVLALVFLYGVGRPPAGVPASVGGLRPWTLLAAVALANAVFVLLGLCMVTLTRAHFRSYLYSNLAFLALVFFGGAMLPLQLYPDWGVAVGKILPSSHAAVALEAILGRNAGLGDIWRNLAALGAWAAALAAVAWRTFDWMILEKAR